MWTTSSVSWATTRAHIRRMGSATSWRSGVARACSATPGSVDKQTLALMHGSTFRGDGEQAVLDLAAMIKQTLGSSDA